MDNPAIAEAYERAGGRKTVMASLGAKKQSLSDWIRKGYVPADKAAQLEAISGVSRRALCPHFNWEPPKPHTKAARQPKSKQEQVGSESGG
jgi:DNA-binding transcriptional regulator YdaS (Cro superfamily)